MTNNLYRNLAPVTDVAWTEIELEATRTFKRHIAGRRVVDVSDPGGPVTAAVSTGRLVDVEAPSDGVVAHLRESKPLVRLRVPFTLSRVEIDNVERGALDSDWDPVKEAAKKLAFITELRLAGVDGPYSVLLSADVYTKVSETTEHGYPILEHIDRLVPGDIIWAPAIDGAFVLTTRGGDFDLQLGTDVSIGYTSHDADTVQLYLQETLTFLCYTAEASVALSV
jgi:uncharacterized linocin/CFP29 family protein